MKKLVKGIVVAICMVAVMVLAKNQIALGLMNVVDFVGTQTGWNVVTLIDMLNNLYYL